MVNTFYIGETVKVITKGKPMRWVEGDERVRDEVESTVDDLIDAGLAEAFLDEDGDVRFRLTPAGRER